MRRTRSKGVLEDYEPWNYIFVDGCVDGIDGWKDGFFTFMTS
jgi:hypothetical protein